MPKTDSQTTEAYDLSVWVAELSNYGGNSIGNKISHRLEVLRRFRSHILEETAQLLDVTNGILKGSKTINSVFAGQKIRGLKQ